MFHQIFVYYHRGFRTGGQEALHQLVDALRRLGEDAFLIPIPGTEMTERVEQYEAYNAPEAGCIVDEPGCAVVVPEVALRLLRKVRFARRFCWWLSIDFAPQFASERKLLSLPPTHGMNDLKRLKHVILKSLWDVRRKFTNYSAFTHLAQSQYAWAFLYVRLNVVPSMLSDFTPVSEFGLSDKVTQRVDTIAYNPAKGKFWVDRISLARPDLKFVAIRNMTREQVVKLLSECAIYLDMGHHPGKDRLPREAALSGAVAIVARRGAGAFWGDVPTPWEHKVSMADPVANAIHILDLVLASPEEAVLKQADYCAKILSEETNFVAQVDAIFVRGQLEFGAEFATLDLDARTVIPE